MGEVVNLRNARKAKARHEADVRADANRALYGRTVAEKTRDQIEAARRARLLDGAKLEGDEPA
jgi:hypothetical protein